LETLEQELAGAAPEAQLECRHVIDRQQPPACPRRIGFRPLHETHTRLRSISQDLTCPLAFLILSKTVESGDSDADILAYFGDPDQRNREFIALVLLLAASLFLIVFVSALRGRLEYAEGGAGVWTMAAFGAGLVSTALWTVAATLYAAPSLQTYGKDGFQLDPDTFRLLNSAGFVAWYSGGTIMSVLVLATSVLGIRAGVVPRWLSWLGFAVALLLLAAFAVIPVIVLLAWLLTVSIALVWRGDTPKYPLPRNEDGRPGAMS